VEDGAQAGFSTVHKEATDSLCISTILLFQITQTGSTARAQRSRCQSVHNYDDKLGLRIRRSSLFISLGLAATAALRMCVPSLQ